MKQSVLTLLFFCCLAAFSGNSFSAVLSTDSIPSSGAAKTETSAPAPAKTAAVSSASTSASTAPAPAASAAPAAGTSASSPFGTFSFQKTSLGTTYTMGSAGTAQTDTTASSTASSTSSSSASAFGKDFKMGQVISASSPTSTETAQ